MAAGLSGEALVAAIERIESASCPPECPPDKVDIPTDIPVDIWIEKRRAYDRDRKRRLRKMSGGMSGGQCGQPLKSLTEINGHVPGQRKAATFLSKKEDSKKENKKERGCRCPPDWKPSEADRKFAAELGCTEAEIESEAAGFVDYWIAKPGKEAIKLDWSRTWHNRIRSFCDRKGKVPAPHIADPGNPYLDPNHPRYRDYLGGWRPGMPTREEIYAKNGGDNGDSGNELAPLVQGGNVVRPAKQKLVRGTGWKSAGQGLEGLFSKSRMDPDDSF